jgi:PAS domain S-box-containing protein
MIEAADERDTTIAELRQRLAEAEDTLSAIRKGEVDALVVAGGEADEIFTIEGEGAYRAFMETMDPGAVALDASGRVLYANSKLTSLLAGSLEDLQGRALEDVLEGGNASLLVDMLGKPDRTESVVSMNFRDPDGAERHFDVSAKPLRIGVSTGFAVTFVDVTARVRAEAAEQSERAARAVIASANEAVLVCDRDGIITHANAAANSLGGGVLIGAKFADAVKLVFPGATGLLQGDDVVASALGGQSLQGIEAVVPNAPRIKDYLVSAAPLRVTGDQISGCVVTMVDLSQRKAAEKQQLLLMAELDHRVKNTLALVQSISSRTLSSEDTLEGYHAAFSGRIQALAATHNLLAERSWNSLQLKDVLISEMAPYVDQGAGRVDSEGLEISISPRAAIALGLIVHELATNAVKYGALSNGIGKVSIAAAARHHPGTPFVFVWRESGGPAVEPSTRRGFGKTVIARSLQYSPQGKAELTLDPSGAVCTISIPAEDVVG